MSTCYLYRHIRLDKNEPFYIGIGKELTYGRAYDKSERSKYWKNVTSSTNYKVEIMLENLSWEEACKKEKEFIQLYGRKDLEQGTLCNFTNGGEGAYGRLLSEESKQKISKSVSGSKHGMQVLNALQMKSGKKAEYNRMGSITQPLQFLPRKEKDAEWSAWCIDWLEWNGLKQLRRNARRLMKNYKLAKGVLDKTDYLLRMIMR